MDARSRFKNFGGRVRERKVPARAAVESLVAPQAAVHPHQSHQPAHEPHATKEPKKLGFFYGRRWMMIAMIVLGLGIIFLAYGYIDTKNQLNKAKQSPEAAGQTEIQKITNQVGKAIKLPSETPTLASVTNVSQLKNQEFFKDAQNGDKVLIYTKSGRALLYRPSTKQVIEYARVNLGNQ